MFRVFRNTSHTRWAVRKMARGRVIIAWMGPVFILYGKDV